MAFFKNPEHHSITVFFMLVLIVAFGWIVISEFRSPGFLAGPIPCLVDDPGSVTLKKPLATDTITAGTPFTVKWAACHTTGPYTVTLHNTSDGSSKILGTTIEKNNKSLSVTLDPTTTPSGSYYVTVTSIDSIVGIGATFPVESSYVELAECILDATNPEGSGTTRYCDVLFADEEISMTTVEYATAPDINTGSEISLMMDIYTPVNDPITSGRPYAIIAHAGGGERGDNQPASLCKDYAGRGFVCGSIDYRGSNEESGFTGTNQKLAQSDMHAANRYFRANATLYGIDPNMAIFGGVSAGAITAVQAAISGNNIDDSYFDNAKVNVSHASEASWACFAFSQSGSANSTVLNDLLDATDPALAMYHGMLDTTVPYAGALDTQTEMVTIGIPTTMLAFADAGHKVGHADEIEANYFPQVYEWVIKSGCPHDYMGLTRL